MRLLHSIEELSSVPGPVCIAIGVFDGVHLGHRAVLGRALEEAKRLEGSMVALTFDPHPAKILRPAAAPHLLTSTAHKLRLIEELGCPCLLKVPFDLEFAKQPPEVFISALAAAAKPLRMICVGRDWSFGRNRSGSVALLRSLGQDLGFETAEVGFVEMDGEPVSSTRIRRLVESGDVAGAGRLLGHTYTILGTIKPGAQLGRKLGFPTANLAAHNEQFPPNGVYAVRARLGNAWRPAVANIGVRPTIESAGERLLEVHVLDFEGECYDEEMEVSFIKLLRGEQKFASLDALREQIARDAADARAILG